MAEEKSKKEDTKVIPLVKKCGMRRFVLERIEDESGVSGTGTILEGVEFSNGKVAITWYSHMGVVGVYDSIKVIVALHGHEGKAKVKWVDPDTNEEEEEPTEE